MISKKEVKELLKSMFAIEENMKNGYIFLHKHVKDEKLKEEFLELSQEETFHEKLIEQLIQLLEK